MKRLIAAASAFVMAALLGACSVTDSAIPVPAEEPGFSEGYNAFSDENEAEDPDAEDDVYVDIGDKLVLYSAVPQSDIDVLVEQFNLIYPDCEVEVVTGATGELTTKIALEASDPQGDIMWGGLSNSDGDMYADLFEHWLSDYEDELIEEYRSNNGFYSLDHISTCVLCVNTELEQELGLNITGYESLKDPALYGKIIMSDPETSSSAWNNICNIISVYGVEYDEAYTYLEDLIKNGLVITPSSSDCFEKVESGEYVVGLTYEDGVASYIKDGAKNIRMVYPSEGTSASASGCAVIKGCPHPAAAMAMLNFLMSTEGQNALTDALGTLRMTNANTVLASPYLPETDEIIWVDRDVDWLADNKREILYRWSELFTD